METAHGNSAEPGLWSETKAESINGCVGRGRILRRMHNANGTNDRAPSICHREKLASVIHDMQINVQICNDPSDRVLEMTRTTYG